MAKEIEMNLKLYEFCTEPRAKAFMDKSCSGGHYTNTKLNLVFYREVF